MNVSALFEKTYRKIAVRENYIENPHKSGMDNWSSDRWSVKNGNDEIVVGMSDAGYSRWVAKHECGKVVWRVNDYYPNPLAYQGITEEDFVKFCEKSCLQADLIVV